MSDLVSSDRVNVTPTTCAVTGEIAIDWAKTIWLATHIILALVGGVLFFSWTGLAIFAVLTAITICAGHSVGMHRLLIHRSFQTRLGVERILVWLGTLVGMAGPMGMIIAHDMRDWHQKQSHCPPHPSHNASFFKDAYWQLCCKFTLNRPPCLTIEPRVADDPFYKFIERHWMVQQLPVALVLFLLGGISWVIFGISIRIAVSLIGHWMVGHFAHRAGHQGWIIQDLPVQGYNLPGIGLITFGENWHGNHHAFPHSARLGIEPGQTDPGYWFIMTLGRMGLAWDINHPTSRPKRRGLRRV